MSFKDLRRREKYEKQKQRFKNHKPRTLKDQIGPRNATSYGLSKRKLIKMAEETLRLTEEDSSQIKTITYQLDDLNQLPEEFEKNQFDTEFEVESESTLDGYFRLIEEGSTKIGVLNFASAKNPGGGFLNGSMAQEESLALSTGLYFSIKDNPIYQINRDDPKDGLYHHSVIYSPKVPVIRDATGDLIEEVRTVDILTVPAVNWGNALKKDIDIKVIQQNVVERMDYLLGVAAVQGIEVLILGSWGCGVFGGDINFVARSFISLLTKKYEGVFRGICFSTPDPTHQQVFERELDEAF